MTTGGVGVAPWRSASGLGAQRHVEVVVLWKILGALIVLWLVVSVIGFVIKSLLWLAVVGLVLAAGTVVYGAVKGSSTRKLPR